MFPVTQMRWVTFGCYGTLVDGQVRGGDVRLFDDVEWMLAELRRNGYRLAVLTNGGDRRFERTHRAFRQPFDLFVTAERVRASKPSHRHFRAFEQLARTTRHDWVHVASSWYHDIAPASSFGLASVWLDRGRTGGSPVTASAHVYTAAGAVDAIVGLFDRAEAGIGA